MRARHTPYCVPFAALALFVAAAAACGSDQPYDWKNRQIDWVYGPTKGGATFEHLTGTGTQGAGAISSGWQCRLSDGRQLTVRPYELASSHALFGKALLHIGLFDKNSQQLTLVRSGTITADNATFSFDLDEAVAKKLYDLVIWFGEA